jgi:hypothetical protein
MERQRRSKSKNPNAAHFPIFSYEDYDFQFWNAPWPIGLKSTYPEELVRRIAAAFISLQMGNSGVDYTYKRYLKDAHYEMNDGSRLDLKITRTIAQRMKLLSDLISRVAQFEGTKAIGWLGKSCPIAGRLYGWLSVHAHWAYEGHIKAWTTDDEGRLAALFATSEFKARSLALGILLSLVSEVSERAFMSVKKNEISKTLSMKDEPKPIEFHVEKPFRFERVSTVEELKELLQSDALTQLAAELVRLCPDDTDVNELAEMTSAAAAV